MKLLSNMYKHLDLKSKLIYENNAQMLTVCKFELERRKSEFLLHTNKEDLYIVKKRKMCF